MLTAGRFRNCPCRIGKVRRCHALVIGLAFVNVAAIAGAQQYLTLPIDEKARPNRTIAQQCLRNPQLYAANKDKVADYFVNYYFPSMTRTEPDKLGEVGKLREELFKYFLWKTTNAELQHDLTDLAYKQAGRIVTADVPPCHPAARYNAILVIGLLDDQYSPDGRQPPKPYAPATQALTGVVNLATTDNRFPPPVILGAVIGLERHAQLHNALAPKP